MRTPIQNVAPNTPTANAPEVWVKWNQMRANIENEIKKAFGQSPEDAIGTAIDAGTQRGKTNAAIGRTDKFRPPPAISDEGAQRVANAQSRGYKLPKAEE
jgi:hypothetical protein